MYLDQLLDPIVLSLLAIGLFAMLAHQVNRRGVYPGTR